MRLVGKFVVVLLMLLAALAGYLYFFINQYQLDGEIHLSGLQAPVTVYRDELRIPYIEASNISDALKAQGFIVAQERTFQIQLYRLLALGRLAEVFGDRGLNSDLLIRMIDIQGLAERQVAALDESAKQYYQDYVDGINVYLLEQSEEHPFEVSALGFKPEVWTLRDIVAVQIFQSWANGSAWKTDLINLQLIDEVGAEHAQQIAQISINPEDGSQTEADLDRLYSTYDQGQDNLALSTLDFLSFLPNSLSMGSNAWATGSRLSHKGMPILANSPHLPATTLPGFWLPMGIFTPQLQAAGVTAPGSPGIGVGRNQHIAWGATVGGSDGADIYIEKLDPNKADHYIQDGKSLPLRIRETTIKIKDGDADNGLRTASYRFRYTPRGPLISDHAIAYSGEVANRALSLRWAAAKSLNRPSLGSDRLFFSRNITEAENAMRLFPGALSHIGVDAEGGIARVSSGRVPVRTLGDGSRPLSVDRLGETGDNWAGEIHADALPKLVNPAADWVGTANHRLISASYPYQYSKNFASSWRFRRIQEFFASKNKVTVDDHWSLINDIKNPMAEHLVPLYSRALQESYPELADILDEWNFIDNADVAAPAIFQVMTVRLAQLTFADELSEELWTQIFDTPYFWQERLVAMLGEPQHPWFDIQHTEKREDRDEILRQAADETAAELKRTLGEDSSQWRWGDIHTITFKSPVIPGKRMAALFGAGTHAMYGTGETLNRSAYKPSKGYDTEINDSVRLVVDMSDDQKLLANIPGGVSARYFDKSNSNQVDDWLNGQANPIWFDLERVKASATHTLSLVP